MSNIGLFSTKSTHQQQQLQQQPHQETRPTTGPQSMPNPRSERADDTRINLFSSLQTPRGTQPMRPILPMGPMSVAIGGNTRTKNVQLNATNNDPVGMLIQYAHQVNVPPPEFHVVSSVGPSHKPLFDMQVSFFLLLVFVWLFNLCSGVATGETRFQGLRTHHGHQQEVSQASLCSHCTQGASHRNLA